MTFYCAGPWKEQEFVKGVAGKLREAGYIVNSRWLETSSEPPEGVTMADYLHEQAVRDLEDVFAADALIYVNPGTLSEGKATELGIAIATLKPIIIVGENGRKGNVFLNLNIPAYPTIEEAIAWLKAEDDRHIHATNRKAGRSL